MPETRWSNGGRELLAFVDALVGPDIAQLDRARSDLLGALGARAVVRASAVTGNFQMMNRLVDATCVAVGSSLREIATDLGLDDSEQPT